MRNLIELAGRLVRGPDDCEHQPLRCEAARALRDAHYEIERLQEIVEDLKAELLGRVDKNVKLVKQQAEIEELQGIIDGAFAHSYGPYSDKELLRRVVVILKTVTREAAEAAEKVSKSE